MKTRRKCINKWPLTPGATVAIPLLGFNIIKNVKVDDYSNGELQYQIHEAPVFKHGHDVCGNVFQLNA